MKLIKSQNKLKITQREKKIWKKNQPEKNVSNKKIYQKKEKQSTNRWKNCKKNFKKLIRKKKWCKNDIKNLSKETNNYKSKSNPRDRKENNMFLKWIKVSNKVSNKPIMFKLKVRLSKLIEFRNKKRWVYR